MSTLDVVYVMWFENAGRNVHTHSGCPNIALGLNSYLSVDGNYQLQVKRKLTDHSSQAWRLGTVYLQECVKLCLSQSIICSDTFSAERRGTEMLPGRTS